MLTVTHHDHHGRLFTPLPLFSQLTPLLQNSGNYRHFGSFGFDTILQFAPDQNDDSELGTWCTNTTRCTNTNETRTVGYFDEDPPNYPHQLIRKLLQKFTVVPGLFETEGTQKDLEINDVVHNNNFDFELEMFK